MLYRGQPFLVIKKILLHLCRVNGALASLWHRYLESAGHVGAMTMSALHSAYKNFFAWRGQGLNLTSAELTLLKGTMDWYVCKHSSVEIGGVTFWASDVKEHFSWFLFPWHADDDGVMYFGRIEKIFSHCGPMGSGECQQEVTCASKLLQVQYFCARKRANHEYEPYDFTLCAPVVHSSPVKMPYGNIWPASDVAPVAITVRPHPFKKDHHVVLHRDVFFAMCGGHPAPDILRMLL
jgi:hypothetical protein